jgi:hypothetical protein
MKGCTIILFLVIIAIATSAPEADSCIRSGCTSSHSTSSRSRSRDSQSHSHNRTGAVHSNNNIIINSATNPTNNTDRINNTLLESYFFRTSSLSYSSSSSSSTSTTPGVVLRPFTQYSGCLNGTHPILGCCGCDETHSTGNNSNKSKNTRSPPSSRRRRQQRPEVCQLHYWFIMEQNDESDDTYGDVNDKEEIDAKPTSTNHATKTQSKRNYNNNNNGNNKPIIVWFNGGPGASSMVGLFQEMGPFFFTSQQRRQPQNNCSNHCSNTTTTTTTTTAMMDPKIILNPYRWTKMAHLLFIEHPVGVGYSYCRDSSTTGTSTAGTTTATTTTTSQSTRQPPPQRPPCIVTDDTASQMALYALIDFYSKFPSFAPSSQTDNFNHPMNTTGTTPMMTANTSTTITANQTDLYLMGESYAGVYIPTLARAIVQYNKNHRAADHEDDNKKVRPLSRIPLRGIAVGDPCTDTDSQSHYMDPLWYAHNYGLVNDNIYTMLTTTCQETTTAARQGRVATIQIKA